MYTWNAREPDEAPISNEPVPDRIDELATILAEKIVKKRPRPAKRLYSIGDASEYLGMTESAIRNKVAAGQLPHVQIDRKLRFDRVDLDRWIEEHRKLED
jgi:excisionase family DNA binding protein